MFYNDLIRQRRSNLGKPRVLLSANEREKLVHWAEKRIKIEERKWLIVVCRAFTLKLKHFLIHVIPLFNTRGKDQSGWSQVQRCIWMTSPLSGFAPELASGSMDYKRRKWVNVYDKDSADREKRSRCNILSCIITSNYRHLQLSNRKVNFLVSSIQASLFCIRFV